MTIDIREDYNLDLGESPTSSESPLIKMFQTATDARNAVTRKAAITLYHVISPLVIHQDPSCAAPEAMTQNEVQWPISREGKDPIPSKTVLGPGVFIIEVWLDTSISPLFDNPGLLMTIEQRPLILEAFNLAIQRIGLPRLNFTSRVIKTLTYIKANETILGEVFRRYSSGYYAEIGALGFDHNPELYQGTEYTGTLDQLVPANKKRELFDQLKETYQEAIQIRINEFLADPELVQYR